MSLNILEDLPPKVASKLLYLIAVDQIFLSQYNEATDEYEDDFACACVNTNDIFVGGADAYDVQSIEELLIYYDTYNEFGPVHVYGWAMYKNPDGVFFKESAKAPFKEDAKKVVSFIEQRWVK